MSGRRRSPSRRKRRCMVASTSLRGIRYSSSRARMRVGRASSLAESSPRPRRFLRSRGSSGRRHASASSSDALPWSAGAWEEKSSNLFRTGKTVDPKPSSTLSSIVRQQIRFAAFQTRQQRSCANSFDSSSWVAIADLVSRYPDGMSPA